MSHTTRIFLTSLYLVADLQPYDFDKSICNVGECHKHVLIVPCRIVLFINFAGCEEFVGRYKVVFNQAEKHKLRKRLRTGV